MEKLSVFNSVFYKDFLKKYLGTLPKKGHGELTKMAEHLSVSPTLLSQIVNASKHFTEDQAYQIAEYLGLNEKETYYFTLMVQRDRAGHYKLKGLLTNQIQKIQTDAQQTKTILEVEEKLGFEQQAVYYSTWLYSAVHAITSLRNMKSVPQLAQSVGGVPVTQVAGILEFLLRVGLCKETEEGIVPGITNSYLPPDSPFAYRHLANWRQKALEVIPKQNENNFFFTAPITISEKDFITFRRELVQLVTSLSKAVAKTKPEQLACVNIDYFSVN